MTSHSLHFGTCSWNYDSWVGLVYDKTCGTAAEYLAEYAKKYTTAEIDSWFYHVPAKKEVLAYKAAIGSDFKFTCKVPQEICLTHLRGKVGSILQPNPNFLSLDPFSAFLDAVEPLKDQIAAFLFEFECLNKEKMPSLQIFMDKLSDFFSKTPSGLPYAIEPRNAYYLTKPYFEFIQKSGLIHVFSEKLYMPHIYHVYNDYKDSIGVVSVIRLLGGNRKDIEEKTGEIWDKVVQPQNDLPSVARMIHEMSTTKTVFINVNNHYEGSAPRTIESLMGLV